MGFLILRAMDERCLYDFIPDCIVCGLTNFCKLDTWGLKHMYAGLCAPGLMDLQRWDTSVLRNCKQYLTSVTVRGPSCVTVAYRSAPETVGLDFGCFRVQHA